MLAAAAASAALKIAGPAGDFLGSYDKEKDAARQATNARAYAIAQDGGPLGIEAFHFLKGRSGKYGPLLVRPIPGVTDGGSIDGWGSDPAKLDAYKKATALAPKYEGAALPNPGDTTQSTVLTNPLTGQPVQVATAGLNAGPLVVVGLIVAVLWLATRKG
jgi:hypothetical protein